MNFCKPYGRNCIVPDRPVKRQDAPAKNGSSHVLYIGPILNDELGIREYGKVCHNAKNPDTGHVPRLGRALTPPMNLWREENVLYTIRAAFQHPCRRDPLAVPAV